MGCTTGKRILLYIILFTCFGYSTFAATYQVGSTRVYPTPHALYLANVLDDGDVIEIDAEVYTGQDALAAWTQNQLVIRGVGGQAHLQANGAYIWGKAIWVLAGDDITVENIEFSGAAVPDQNGAGIRLDGNGMTIRYCYFHNNENGILTAASSSGDILVEHTEFGYNGFGGGQTHNIYVNQTNSLTFRYNYSHHANIGHTLKSRARENYIYYNRIMDEQTGNSSRLIDISNGGFTIIMGNLLMQGENAENNNLIGYGLEGLSNANSELHVINNTMVNKRVASCIFVAIQSGTPIANIRNNIFAGSGTLISGTTTAISNNYVNPTISSLNFINEANYNYELSSNSPAINYGTVLPSANGTSLTPNQYYNHPLDFGARVISDAVIDAGAYEFGNNVIPPISPKSEITIELGDMTIESSDYGVILTAPNGNCFRLKVGNTGELITEAVICP